MGRKGAVSTELAPKVPCQKPRYKESRNEIKGKALQVMVMSNN